MATKIYISGGAIVLENSTWNPTYQAINPNAFDWQIDNNGIFSVRDKIENQSYELGIFSDIQSEFGTAFTSNLTVSNYFNSITNKSNTNLGTNMLSLDAWGRQKIYQDYSILHGMFTFNVPVSTWKEIYNDVEQAITIATSVNGHLSMKAGANLNDENILCTFRNPRYRPNKGHLYSTAVILPNLTANGIREFGLFTKESGVFFRLKSSGFLYAVVRTTVNSVTTEDEQLINTTGFDFSKGNVYDIQFQWRGVGNYKFFINLKEVYCFNYLGTRTELSMWNPALPIGFRCENLGNNPEIICGCVDVATEGGDDNGKIYGSISVNNESGQIGITGYNVPIMAVRSKLTVNGKINTRDTIALLLSAYSSENGFIRVWATRDFTAITPNNQSWIDFGDGHLEYIIYDTPDVATPMTFNTAKATLIFGCRIGADQTYSTSALFEGRTDIWLTPGDMFVFTMHRENGILANMGCTFEFAEEI